jgi:hypothetical protein
VLCQCSAPKNHATRRFAARYCTRREQQVRHQEPKPGRGCLPGFRCFRRSLAAPHCPLGSPLSLGRCRPGSARKPPRHNCLARLLIFDTARESSATHLDTPERGRIGTHCSGAIGKIGRFLANFRADFRNRKNLSRWDADGRQATSRSRPPSRSEPQRLPLLNDEGQVMLHVSRDAGQHLPHRFRDLFTRDLDEDDVPVEGGFGE